MSEDESITVDGEVITFEEFRTLWSKLTEEDRQEWLEHVKKLSEGS